MAEIMEALNLPIWAAEDLDIVDQRPVREWIENRAGVVYYEQLEAAQVVEKEKKNDEKEKKKEANKMAQAKRKVQERVKPQAARSKVARAQRGTQTGPVAVAEEEPVALVAEEEQAGLGPSSGEEEVAHPRPIRSKRAMSSSPKRKAPHAPAHSEDAQRERQGSSKRPRTVEQEVNEIDGVHSILEALRTVEDDIAELAPSIRQVAALKAAGEALQQWYTDKVDEGE
jgi:hypothetical protein